MSFRRPAASGESSKLLDAKDLFGDTAWAEAEMGLSSDTGRDGLIAKRAARRQRQSEAQEGLRLHATLQRVEWGPVQPVKSAVTVRRTLRIVMTVVRQAMWNVVKGRAVVEFDSALDKACCRWPLGTLPSGVRRLGISFAVEMIRCDTSAPKGSLLSEGWAFGLRSLTAMRTCAVPLGIFEPSHGTQMVARSGSVPLVIRQLERGLQTSVYTVDSKSTRCM